MDGQVRRSGTAGFDPVQRATDVARIVCRGSRRKYRVSALLVSTGASPRPTAWGATCGASSAVLDEVVRAEGKGEFCSPEDVARRLVDIARKKRYGQVRISGNEPTLCRDHLLGVLERIPPDLLSSSRPTASCSPRPDLRGGSARFPNSTCG